MGQSRAADYAQINAVVHALYADQLSPDKMRELARCESLDVLLTLLGATPYGPYLSLPRHMLTSRRTVYQLRLRIANIYEKLIRLTPKPARDFIKMLWHAYEVDNIKATLRGIENHASWPQVLFLLSPINSHNLVELDTLQTMLESGDMVMAVEQLRRTPYYHPLSYSISRYQTEHSLFALEIALDLDYRRRLWKMIDTLQGEDHKQALRLIGSVLDKDNLLWAIRYRVYHKLSPEEIINYTLARGYHVKDTMIRAIARQDRIQDVLERAYPHIQAIGDMDVETPGQLIILENILTADIQRLCHQTFGGSPFHLGIPLAYILLLEQEVRALTAIIEVKASSSLDTKALNAILESYVQIAIDVQN